MLTPEAEELTMQFGSNQLDLIIQLLLEIVLIMAWMMFTSSAVVLLVKLCCSNHPQITRTSLAALKEGLQIRSFFAGEISGSSGRRLRLSLAPWGAAHGGYGTRLCLWLGWGCRWCCPVAWMTSMNWLSERIGATGETLFFFHGLTLLF